MHYFIHTEILPYMAQSLTENHASVHKLKAREYTEMNALNRTYVHESAHLYPRKISVVVYIHG